MSGPGGLTWLVMGSQGGVFRPNTLTGRVPKGGEQRSGCATVPHGAWAKPEGREAGCEGAMTPGSQVRTRHWKLTARLELRGHTVLYTASGEPANSKPWRLHRPQLWSLKSDIQ